MFLQGQKEQLAWGGTVTTGGGIWGLGKQLTPDSSSDPEQVSVSLSLNFLL